MIALTAARGKLDIGTDPFPSSTPDLQEATNSRPWASVVDPAQASARMDVLSEHIQTAVSAMRNIERQTFDAQESNEFGRMQKWSHR
jgi:hypothetical protein